ncbi:hypothetical protein [Dictyobacter arantiisoli]|uniref:Uncharacterized protein n=1 Tax=Dictyobacter arantiisoli TaxID=2014874 RepID=A0A5A5T604_9CHLR|nr:hypothetical protein [Dictyobacter arantiisoli]GCF06871.1 hypothetical protein KDI_04350 [Dictyobacter arantiisoli]
MAQHVSSLHSAKQMSDFEEGQSLGMHAVTPGGIEDVRKNPSTFVDGIFDLYDPNITEAYRAGYVVGYLRQVFTSSHE